MEVGTLIGAIEFSRRAHDGQFRKNEKREPYIYHPMRLMHWLYVNNWHQSDMAVYAAAVLHDVAEDTSVTLEDI